MDGSGPGGRKRGCGVSLPVPGNSTGCADGKNGTDGLRGAAGSARVAAALSRGGALHPGLRGFLFQRGARGSTAAFPRKTRGLVFPCFVPSLRRRPVGADYRIGHGWIILRVPPAAGIAGWSLPHSVSDAGRVHERPDEQYRAGTSRHVTVDLALAGYHGGIRS